MLAIRTVTAASRRRTHRLGSEMSGVHGGIAKAAELASGLGAAVLGAGLTLMLPPSLRSYALALLISGVAVHGVGMTLKYRLESRDGPPLWWERTLFWLCWACLIALGIWFAMGVATAPE